MTVLEAPRPILGRALDLDHRVALRPERFGALAYHSGNRRLVFLKHPDIVRVVMELADHDSVGQTLTACGIEAHRHRSFVRAITSLLDSEMLRERPD